MQSPFAAGRRLLMKGIILYSSRYGSTEKYARWLAEATGFPCRETKAAGREDIEGCDTVILGGGVYASGIAGLSFLKRNLRTLEGKQVLVFCVGASPYDEKALEEIRERAMTGPLCEVPLFYCRGAWNKEKMTFRDRALCTLLQKAVDKKDPADYAIWERALVEAGDKPRDWTDRAYLTPILAALRR